MTPAAYRRALERLQGLARFGMRPGLEATTAVLAALGHPEARFPSLHIAGTNGKGSTAACAEAMLRAAGARTGLYTSPHLLRFTERIRVAGEEVAPERVASLIERVLAAPGGDRLTFFEVATVAAFVHFAEQGVDLAVVECGLGGRLDATSTCRPFASVVTSVALDHTEVLGATLEAIATEKAGIARAGVPLLMGVLPPPAAATVAAIARERGAPLLALGADFVATEAAGSPGLLIDYRGPGGPLEGAPVGLAGSHQLANAALALAATAFAPTPFAPDEAARRAGLATVRWPARLERVGDLLLDGAHNPAAAAALATAAAPAAPLVLLVGVLDDKDAAGLLAPLLPLASALVCTRPPSSRGLPAAALAARARTFAPPGLPIEAHDEPAAALARARALAAPPSTDRPSVLACGSLYLVGRLRGLLTGEPADDLALGDPTRLADRP